jgi:hypothetical protein
VEVSDGDAVRDATDAIAAADSTLDAIAPTDTPVATDARVPNDGAPAGDPCAPLAAATGNIVRVRPDQADQLPTIAAAATTGTTLLFEDGTYRMTTSGESARRINLRTPGVTLRSASGNPDAVVIDGEYLTNEMIVIEASDVTVAEITVTHAIDHPIHVTAPDAGPDTRNTRLYRLVVIDGGEQFVKVNPPGNRAAFVDEGTLECSRLRLTDAGRPHIERNPGGCYTGGIDAHSARGWRVAHNTFEDIYCAGEGLAEHAIHFWVGSRDTIVENNTITNCARGVGFGLVDTGTTRVYADDPYPGVGFIGHYDGVIRNNTIFASIAFYDTGIELDQARGAHVHHNTIVETDSATGRFSSIDARFDHTVVTVQNNLVRRLTVRDTAVSMADHDVESVPLEYFANATGGDFHLTAAATMAIDQGAMVTGAGVDLDGEPHTRGAGPDIGADER